MSSMRLSLKTSCNPVWTVGRAYRPDTLSVSLLQYMLFPLLYIVRNNLEILMTCILNWKLFPFASIAMLFNLVKGMFVSGSMCVYHKFSIEYFSTFNMMFLLCSYIIFFQVWEFTIYKCSRNSIASLLKHFKDHHDNSASPNLNPA